MAILYPFEAPEIIAQKRGESHRPQTRNEVDNWRRAHSASQGCHAGLQASGNYPSRYRRKTMEETIIAYEPIAQRRRSSFGQSLARLIPKKVVDHGDPRAGHDDLLRLEGQIFQTLRVSPKIKVKFGLSEILARIFKELFLCTRFSTQLTCLLEQPRTFFVLEGDARNEDNQDLQSMREELRSCVRELDWNHFRPIGDVTGSATSSGAWLLMKKLVERGWSWQIEDENGKSSLVLKLSAKSA